MKRILISLAVISSTLVLAFGLSKSFFSDTETSVGNTFEAGAIDLKIDNTSYYRGELWDDTTWEYNDLTNQLFFNFTDVKPGDWGEDTISLHVNTNDAWACMDMSLTSDDDNSCTDSELGDGDSCVADNGDLLDGELGGLINIIFWVDDGDNVLEDDEEPYFTGTVKNLLDGTSWALSDSLSSFFDDLNPDGALLGEQDYYIAKAWCFGTLGLDEVGQDAQGALDPVTNGPLERGPGITCDGSGLNNISQTDSVVGDISFFAEQARNNTGFICGQPPSPSPSPTPSPTPIACIEGNPAKFQDNLQGDRKDGGDVLADRSDPADGFVPQTTGVDSDAGFPAGSFFSLGFGGSIVYYDFPSPIVDITGDDLQIFETTGGVYPDEKVMVEVSQDGTTWFVVATSATRDELLDISSSGLSYANYVRLTDVSDINLFTDDADGYDLDGITSICPQTD
jgi:hypothetical protein